MYEKKDQVFVDIVFPNMAALLLVASYRESAL
jgi:hypothetical protein